MYSALLLWSAILSSCSCIHLKNPHKQINLLEIYNQFVSGIERSFQFYEKYGMFMNPDGLVGLQVIVGEVDYALSIGYRRTPPSLYKQLQIWKKRARVLLYTLIPHIKEKEKEYYDKIGHLIEIPFAPFGDGIMSYKRIDETLVWDASVLNHSQFGEFESDQCLKEFKNDENRQRDNHGCHLTNHCVKQMLLLSNTWGYAIAHQALYIHFIRQLHCIPQINLILKSVGRTTTVSIIEKTICSNMYNQMTAHLQKFHGYFACDDRDLFSEFIFACGSLGYTKFINLTFLEHLLSWQHPEKGCFTDVVASSTSENPQVGKCRLAEPSLANTSQASSRKLKMDVTFPDGCSTHFTSTALSALAIHLRLFFDRFISSSHPESSHVYETFSKMYMELKTKKFLPVLLQSPSLTEKRRITKNIAFVPSFLPANIYKYFKNILSQL